MNDENADVRQARSERKERVHERLRRISAFHWLAPDIARRIARHVVGQDQAVRRVATLYRAHIRRMQEAIKDDTVLEPARQHGESGPILLIGPSGVGKSLLIRTMAQMGSLPCVIEDASSHSSTGYVGRSVSDALAQLMVQSDAEIGIARWAILGIDEFDKIRRRNSFGGVDVGGEGVQRCILSLLDGGVVQFEWPPGATRDGRTWCSFSTANLMIILAGAFEGLDDVVRERLGHRRGRIGFDRSGETKPRDGAEILSQVTPDDLVRYGFLPEVVGRIRDIVVMRELDRDDLRRILLEAPEGPLASFQKMAAREGFRFSLSDALVDAIVDEAMSSALGARSLHGIVSRVTQPALFDVPGMLVGLTPPLYTVKLGPDALEDGSHEVQRPRRRRSKSKTAEKAAEA